MSRKLKLEELIILKEFFNNFIIMMLIEIIIMTIISIIPKIGVINISITNIQMSRILTNYKLIRL